MPSSSDLRVTIPVELVDDFLSKLHYVSEGMQDFKLLTEYRNRVSFNLLPGYEHQAQIVAERIAEVAQKMCRAYRQTEERVLIAREGTGSYDVDPQPLLQGQQQLYNYGQGRFGLGPRLVELVNFFDRKLVHLTERFSAEAHQFPSLIGADVLERCKYLRSFPHALTLVTHLREDLEAIQNFSRTARWDGRALNCNYEDLGHIECLLAPAVCFHCYAWLQNSRQTASRAFTALGKCFRYESGNLSGLERLWDFTMRELIFVGTQEYVLMQRQKAIDESVQLLDEWGLAYEIRSATDPFFIEEYASAGVFQRAFALKFEVQATLPYKRKALAIGSFNFHQDYFGRSLAINDAENGPSHTGCVGFGLERVALAFLAQHGLNHNDWPLPVAREMRSW